MALVINPDGTVTTVEADYNTDGSLKIKRGFSFDDVEEPNKLPSYIAPVKKTVVNRNSATTSKKRKRKAYFASRAEIDMWVNERKAINKKVEEGEYYVIANTLPNDLKAYFKSKFVFRHTSDVAENDNIGKVIENPKKKKNKKKNKNRAKAEVKAKVENKAKSEAKDAVTRPSTRSGFSLGEIANFSALDKNAPVNDMFIERFKSKASQKPKYGYARDRYGRVQERDSYNENRSNEFYNAQKKQTNYDYSSYDANDDHDGAYSDWE